MKFITNDWLKENHFYKISPYYWAKKTIMGFSICCKCNSSCNVISEPINMRNLSNAQITCPICQSTGRISDDLVEKIEEKLKGKIAEDKK